MTAEEKEQARLLAAYCRARKTEQERLLAAERRAKLMTVMTGHVGRIQAISMGALYKAVFGRDWTDKINDTCKLRDLITTLRKEGLPICSTWDGYYLAAAGSELQDYLARYKRRALRILARVAMIKKITLPELMGQIQMEMTEAIHDDDTA